MRDAGSFAFRALALSWERRRKRVGGIVCLNSTSVFSSLEQLASK